MVTVAWNDGRTKQMITQDTSYGVVTSSRNGLMSAADKRKLDSLTPAAYEILSDEELEALLV